MADPPSNCEPGASLPPMVDTTGDDVSYAYNTHLPAHSRGLDKFVDSTVVTSVLEKKLLDVTSSILRLVDDEDGRRDETESVFACKGSQRRKNKMMEGAVAREVARVKMTEVAKRMKQKMHAARKTELEKAFDSLERAYQDYYSNSKSAREEFARCRVHSLKELRLYLDLPLTTSTSLQRNLFLTCIRLAIIGTVHEFQDKEKKLIPMGFALVERMNDAKIVRDACEVFAEDEQHLNGFMFNYRREEKEKREMSKAFLKEVVDINKLFAASLESLQRFEELLAHWPHIQHSSGSFNPVTQFYILQKTEVYVPHENVTTIVCYPNERMLYSGSEDGHLQLWDVDEMKLHQSIVAHTRAAITAMCVGYATVFTGSADGMLKLWNWQPEDDVEKGGGIWQSYKIIQFGSKAVNKILLLQDYVLVGSSDCMVKIFNISLMVPLKSIYTDHEVLSMGVTEKTKKSNCFRSRDEDEDEEEDALTDQLLFCYGKGQLSVYDLKSSDLLHRMQCGPTHSDHHPFAVSQDIFCTAQENDVTIFKTNDFTEIKNMRLQGHLDVVSALEIKGNLLFSGSLDGDVIIWSLSSAAPVRRASFGIGHYGISAISITVLDLQTLSKRATEFSIVEYLFAGCFDGTIMKIPLGFKSQRLKSYLQKHEAMRLAEKERLKFKLVTGVL